MLAQKELGHRRNQVAIYVAQLAHLRGPYQTAIYVAHQMTTYVAYQLTIYVAYQITTYVVPFFAFVFVLYPLGPGALAAVFTFVSYVFSQARSPRGGSRLMTVVLQK